MLPKMRLLTIVSIATMALLLLIVMSGCSGKNDLSGSWKGEITLPNTGNSLSDLEFNLVQKGQVITGTLIFTKPGSKLPLNGTVADGKITLSSPMKSGLAISITGVLADRRTIKGTAVLDYDTPQLGKKQDQALVKLTR